MLTKNLISTALVFLVVACRGASETESKVAYQKPQEQNLTITEFDVQANTGLIIDENSGEIVCKFDRHLSEESFPNFINRLDGGPTLNTEVQIAIQEISNCNDDQLEFAASYANNMRGDLHVAALPAALGVVICGVAFINGAALGLTLFSDEDVKSSSDTFSNIGIQTVGLAGYNKIKGGAARGMFLKGIGSVIKLNFICDGAGAGLGLTGRGIIYLINK